MEAERVKRMGIVLAATRDFSERQAQLKAQISGLLLKGGREEVL